MKRQAIALLLVFTFAILILSGCGQQTTAPSGDQDENYIGGTLNILVMPGYEEEQIIQPFEEKYGVKVNSRVYSSSDQMFSILTNSQPGEWDVVTPDTPWVEKLVAADMIAPLDPGDYPEIKNFYDHWQDFEQLFVNDQMYSIVSRWGYYGIVYNSNYVTEEEAMSMDVMWDPKYKGKIVLFDWYLPNMGMLGAYLGHEQPYEIEGPDLDELEETLYSLRPQVGVIAATNADTIQALANESAWLSFGGEWLQVLLKGEGYPIEVVMPKEGGVSWTESLSIMKHSQNPEAAKAFVQYLISPEVQAKLAWANAFHSTVPNMKAADYLSAEQAALLRMDNPELLNDMLDRIATRIVPANEKEWQTIWEQFKSK
ncbi:MAG: ABC transporter substrate-binding protein [bacterium]|jgi:spermidine/putrescine transport system substrate-binding protein